MKKILVVLLALMIVLAGCGGGNSGGSGTSGTSGTSGSSGGNSGGSDGGSSQPAQVKTMKIGVVMPKERSITQALFQFADMVAEKTNGSVKVEIFPDGVLGGDRDVLEGLQLGTIEGTSLSTGLIASHIPEFNVFDLPFLFENEERAYAVLDGPIGQEMLDKLPDVGLIGLNYWENGFRHLTNSVRPVRTPEDVKGLKIRTLENQLHVDAWKALGALPTPMSYNELYTALQQKVVDGQENPPGNITTAKFYEVQDHLTLTGHIYNANPLLISKIFWDKLTPEEQQAIREAADAARDIQRELNAKENEDSLKFLREQGMNIIELTSEEKQAFQKALAPIYDQYGPTVGADLLDRILNYQ